VFGLIIEKTRRSFSADFGDNRQRRDWSIETLFWTGSGWSDILGLRDLGRLLLFSWLLVFKLVLH
jgi:hypothetical protein